jgi:hypothetical protein
MANTHSLDLEKDSSQYAAIADASQTGLDITGNLTIEAWIKVETLSTTFNKNQWLVAKWNSDSTQQSYGFLIGNDNKLRFIITEDGTYAVGTTTDAVSTVVITSTGVWYHVAVVFTAATPTVTFYVNGSAQTTSYNLTGGTSIYNSSASLTIGAAAKDGAANTYYDGLIDDVRVWNTTRTESQIADNRSTELVGNESGLVGYWKLNNNYNDSTSNGNNLTAYNSPVFSTDVPFADVATGHTKNLLLLGVA